MSEFDTVLDGLTAAVCRVARDKQMVSWAMPIAYDALLPICMEIAYFGNFCILPNLVILLFLPNLATIAILLFLAHLLFVIVD